MNTKSCLFISILLLSFGVQAVSASPADTCKPLLLNTKTAEVDDGAWIETFKSEWARQGTQMTKKQRKLWTEAMSHLTEDLAAMDASASNKDIMVRTRLKAIVEKLPAIQEAWLKMAPEDKKSGYFKEVYVAIWAAITVHSHEIIDAKSKKTDFKRYFAIMDAISGFDPDKAWFSFFKIRRAVTGRFAIKEFINCRD